MTLETENLSANADVRDTGSIPRLGRSSRGGHGKPSVLAWRIPWTETWQATVHRVANSQAQLKQLSMHSIETKKREVLVYMPVFSLLLVPIHRTNRVTFL